jgi:DNA modification methylase
MQIEIKKVKLSEIKLNPDNPRKISKCDMDLLVKSLTDFPEMLQMREIVVDETMTVLGGNMRTLALRKAKAKECTAKIVKGLTPEQKREFIIKDNGSMGEWNMDILANAWSDLPLADWGVKLPEDWMSSEKEGKEDDFDADAEADKIIKPVTKRGDIWLLGKHRIMCGDSTNKEDVELLMGIRQGGLLLTDPPYGINIIGKVDKTTGKGQIGSGGKRYSPIVGDETTETAEKIYRLSQEIGIRKVILWGGNYFTDFLPPSPCWIIWDKRVESSSNNFADCEIAWTSLTSPARVYHQLWNGYSRAGKRDVEGLRRVHPTQKPVGLFAFCINNYSEAEEIILDLFLGSGSALIAAEQLDRICYGMEIDPVYCDVICKRWKDFTGKKPILEQNEGEQHIERKMTRLSQRLSQAG